MNRSSGVSDDAIFAIASFVCLLVGFILIILFHVGILPEIGRIVGLAMLVPFILLVCWHSQDRG